MEIIFKFLVIIALLSFIFLVLIIIDAIKKFQISFKNFEDNFAKLSKDLHEIKEKSTETLNGLNELKAKSIETLSKYDIVADSIIKTSDSVERDSKKIINTFEPFSELINEVYNRIAPPVTQTSRAVRAVSRGINAFFERLLNK